MKKFLKNNGLSLVFFILFLVSLVGQVITGLKQHNSEMQDEGGQQLSMSQYLTSGHFLQSTFENWESEFLQMALFVLLTRGLRQKGSSESKKLEGEEEVDREPDPNKKDAPWPVHKGGLVLSLYKNSLSIILTLLFLLCFTLHFYGSFVDTNESHVRKGLPTESAGSDLMGAKFWFESFQNWQSEFLSIAAIIVLSIYFRQQGSSQSKPVDAPDEETGG